ncbi:NAD(P)-dependent alcohol dehydrogenase, partial [bacterium]
RQYGAPEVLRLAEVEKPTPGEDELLVSVRATTVNVGDCRMRSFTVPAIFWLPGRISLGLTRPRQPVFGMELAGVVEAVGKDVKQFKPGDPVFASTLAENFGAHAEYKCLREDGAVVKKPQAVSDEEAAALPISANTALSFLRAANIRPGQKVLVNGAAGGVGAFAVQLAGYFGAEVTAVCGPANQGLAQSLGAARVLDYTRVDFTRTGETYHIIFDAVGKTTFARCKNALKRDGYFLETVMVAATLQGRWAELTTGKHIVGGTARPDKAGLAFLAELVAAGKLKVMIDRRYPLERIAEAHRYVETGHKKGNVVINVG